MSWFFYYLLRCMVYTTQVKIQTTVHYHYVLYSQIQCSVAGINVVTQYCNVVYLFALAKWQPT